MSASCPQAHGRSAVLVGVHLPGIYMLVYFPQTNATNIHGSSAVLVVGCIYMCVVSKFQIFMTRTTRRGFRLGLLFSDPDPLACVW